MRTLLLLALTAGCARAQAGQETYPLADGLRWTYEADWAEEGGGEPEVEFRMTSCTAADGRPAFFLSSSSEAPCLFIRQTLRREEGAITLVAENDHVLSTPFPALKLPATPGTTWDAERILAGTKIKLSGAIEAEETIRVPAGDYACVRVHLKIASKLSRRDWEEVETWSWLAPGVGTVKYKFRSLSTMVTLRLRKFDAIPDSPANPETAVADAAAQREAMQLLEQRMRQACQDSDAVARAIRGGPAADGRLSAWIDALGAQVGGGQADDELVELMRTQLGAAIRGADDPTVLLLAGAVPGLREEELRVRRELGALVADAEARIRARVENPGRALPLPAECLRAFGEARLALRTATETAERWTPLRTVVLTGDAAWQGSGVRMAEGDTVFAIGLGRMGTAGKGDGVVEPAGLATARAESFTRESPFGALILCLEGAENKVGEICAGNAFEVGGAGQVLFRANAATDLAGGYVVLMAVRKR